MLTFNLELTDSFGFFCQVYVPSTYEKLHIEKAKTVTSIALASERRKVVFDFVTSEDEMKAVRKWVDRVRVRMLWGLSGSSGDIPATADDDYLSQVSEGSSLRAIPVPND